MYAHRWHAWCLEMSEEDTSSPGTSLWALGGPHLRSPLPLVVASSSPVPRSQRCGWLTPGLRGRASAGTDPPSRCSPNLSTGPRVCGLHRAPTPGGETGVGRRSVRQAARRRGAARPRNSRLNPAADWPARKEAGRPRPFLQPGAFVFSSPESVQAPGPPRGPRPTDPLGTQLSGAGRSAQARAPACIVSALSGPQSCRHPVRAAGTQLAVCGGCSG